MVGHDLHNGLHTLSVAETNKTALKESQPN
jgi:hypothetical protein